MTIPKLSTFEMLALAAAGWVAYRKYNGLPIIPTGLNSSAPTLVTGPFADPNPTINQILAPGQTMAA